MKNIILVGFLLLISNFSEARTVVSGSPGFGYLQSIQCKVVQSTNHRGGTRVIYDQTQPGNYSYVFDKYTFVRSKLSECRTATRAYSSDFFIYVTAVFHNGKVTGYQGL